MAGYIANGTGNITAKGNDNNVSNNCSSISSIKFELSHPFQLKKIEIVCFIHPSHFEKSQG